MKNSVFIFLLLLTTATLIYAQMPDGTIPFDCPDVPPAKFQFHFDRELITLVVPTSPFNTVEDLYIHTYDAEAAVFDKLVGYYGEQLKEKGWNIPEETGGMQIYILEEPGLKTDSTVVGIFGVVKSSAEVHLLNIVGHIPPEQLRLLLVNLGELGIEIPELKLLSQLALRKSEGPTLLLPAPTLFRVDGVKKPTKRFNMGSSRSYHEDRQGHWTYRGHPIERIEIRANEKKQVARIREGLKNNSGDITELLDSLLSQNRSVDSPRLIVRTWERRVTIRAKGLPDETEPAMLARLFQTREGDAIQEILIRGNRYTEASTIRGALEQGSGEIEKAIEGLRAAIPAFEKANLLIEEKDSRRTAIITVVEKPPSLHSYMDGAPRIGFNRVTGWKLGMHVETGVRTQKANTISLQSTWPPNMPIEGNRSKLFGQFSYGFGNKQRYYRVGGDAVWGKRNTWHLGLTAQFHRATGIIAPDLFIGDDVPGTLILRMLGIPGHQNYYLRKGGEVALRWAPQTDYRMMSTHAFKMILLAETHESLQKSTDWHFFNWRSTSKARENPVITPAHMRSVIFNYDFNTRRNRLGWHSTFSVEHSNTAVGSDFDFTRYQLHLRYAYPLGSHQVRHRAVGSFSTASLPLQRQFTIGGPGLLNGYPLYAFAGDRGFLFNVEYFYYLPQLFIWKNLQFASDLSLFLVIFFDAGQTWHVSSKKDPFEPKGDAGIGLQFDEDDFILRFNVAKAFDSTQGLQFNLMWFYNF